MSCLSTTPIVSASVIWRGKWFVIASMALSLGAGFGYLHVTPPVYEAEARMLVRQKGPQFEADSGFLKDRQLLATEAEILRSEPILRRALETVEPQLPEGYTGDAMSLVLDSLTVTPSPVADVLTVHYRSHRKQDSVDVIQATIDSYQEMLRESEGNMYVSTVGVLSNREQQLRDELVVLQERYEQLRQSSPLVGQGAESLNLQTQQLTVLGERLATAKSRKFELEKKLESFIGFKNSSPESRDATTLVALRELGMDLVNTSANIETAKASDIHDVVSLSYTGFGDVALHNSAAAQMFRQQAESKLAQMHDVERQFWLNKAAGIRTSQKASHPGYGKIAAELKHWEELVDYHHEDWQTFLDGQVEALSNVLEQELQTARKSEEELEILYAETQANAKDVDSYLLREQLILGNIQRLEKVHETMLARLIDFELADQAVAGGRASVDVKVLEGPELNSHLVWPLPPFILAGSLLLGCLVPIALLAVFGRPQPEKASRAVQM